MSAAVTKVSPSIEPGAVVQYTVVLDNTGGAVAGGGGDITISGRQFGGVEGTVAGGTITPTLGNNDMLLTIADGAIPGTRKITVADTFAAGDPVTITFDVTLPNERMVGTGNGFSVRAASTDVDLGTFTTNSTETDVYKGDGTKTSKLYITAGETTSSPAGLGNWWAPKDSTLATTYTVHNWGDGAAYDVLIQSSANGNATPIQPEKPKAGAPDFSFDTDLEVKTSSVGGDCADVPASPSASDCSLGDIPAGGSKSFTVSTTGLTHLGMTVRPSAYVSNQGLEKTRVSPQDPGWNDSDDWNSGYGAATVKVTDGKSVLPQVSVDGPVLAASRTDVTYEIEISNGGPDAITNGVLQVSSTVFDDKGNPVGTAYVGADKRVASLKSVNIAGVTCGESKDDLVANNTTGKYETKSRLSVSDCVISSLPSGARLTGTIVANYPTGHKDSTVAGDPQSSDYCGNWWGSTRGNCETGSVDVTLFTAHFDKPGSRTYTGASTRLNDTTTSDLDVSVKSAAQIGAQRLGLQVVTVKNVGTSTAKNAWLSGTLWKKQGAFESTLLPGSCTGVAVSDALSCALGDIEAGKSVSITVPVLGPTKVGSTLVTTYSTGSAESDSNPDNNSVAHTQMVVKAALAPLEGVKIVKAPGVLKSSVLGKTGLKSDVTTPGAAKVVANIQVAMPVAWQLGLAKKPKGKAAAPKFLTIGTATKVTKAGGKVTVFTKITKKYKAKVLGAKKPFKAQRVITVTSNAPLTKGATSVTTSNLTIRK